MKTRRKIAARNRFAPQPLRLCAVGHAAVHPARQARDQVQFRRLRPRGGAALRHAGAAGTQPAHDHPRGVGAGAIGRCCAACCPGAATPARRRRRISCSAWPHGCALASRRTSCRAAAGTAKGRRTAARRRRMAHGQRNDGRQTAAAVQPQRTVGRNAGTAAAARRREAQISGSCRIGRSRGTQARGADNRRPRNRQRPPGSRKARRIGKPFLDSRDGIVHECCGKQQASTLEAS